MLAVDSKAQFDDSVTEYEFRTFSPFSTTSFNQSDEVRIGINQQDGLTLPSESYLHLRVSVTKTNGTEDDSLMISNNGMAFLFEEMRYELGGVVIDRTKNVGISSTLHNIVSLTPGEQERLENAGWYGYTNQKVGKKDISVCIPLKMMMGFFEDYNRVIVNQKQELIILLAPSFKNAIQKANATDTDTDFVVKIEKIYWRVPNIKVSDVDRLPLLQILEQDLILEMPFRSWELHEYPNLPKTDRHSWTIKTSSQLEKPRFVILAFQTNRKNVLGKCASLFDHCNVSDVKLYLNSQYYPYDNLKGDRALMYEMYARFQSSYYGKVQSNPILKRETFDSNPIFVIDCSKQSNSLKSGPVDVRIEFEATKDIPDKTSAYCLIIHDSLVEYRPLTGTVNRVI